MSANAKDDMPLINEKFLPIVHSENYKSSALDVALAANLDQEGLLKLKAVEYTIEFMKGRAAPTPEVFTQVFERVHNQIKKDGTTK